jgi:hypothetical protein
LLAGTAIGCGSDDGKLARAREEGRQQALDQQRANEAAAEAARQRRQVARLRREVGALKQRSSSGGGSGSNASPSPSSSSSGSTSCGDGLSVNSVTSCSFARNVRDEYQYGGGGPVIEVYSPVTKHTYVMRCSGGVTTVCTGGNGASVYIR